MTSTARIWFRGHGDSAWARTPTALRDDFLNASKAWAEGHRDEAARNLAALWLGEHPDQSNFAEVTKNIQETMQQPEIACELAGVVVERILNDRFRRTASHALSDAEDLGSVYMQARHAELPSRLLDWTTQPLIALFLACQSDCRRGCNKDGCECGKSGCIWILDHSMTYYQRESTDASLSPPEAMPTPVTDTNTAFTEELPTLFSIPHRRSTDPYSPSNGEMLGEFFSQFLPRPAGQPLRETFLPILPTKRFSRMAAQHGCFTFHPPGSSREVPIGRFREPCEPFEVPASKKRETLRDLRLLGIDESTVWPDLDGAARAARTSLELP